MALVSIIVPVYNAEKHIFRCLSSIAAQDFDDIEVLVVDDGSADSSGRIVSEFAAYNTRFRYIALDGNRGVMAARAVGVRSCGGKFIGFVDADDWIDPSMISKMLHRLQTDESDIAICGVSYANYHGGHAKKYFRFKKSCLIENGLSQFAKRKLGSAYLCNKLYRREIVYGDVSFDFGVRLNLGEDILINFGAFSRARSISLLSDVFYSYGQNPIGSTRGASNAEAFANLLLAYCLCCAHFSNKKRDIMDYVDQYFRVQFNFRCYQVVDAAELQAQRQHLSAALRMLSETRPEAILYLMSVLRRKGRSSVFSAEVFRNLLGGG